MVTSPSRTEYEPVIGLEVHVQLATASKAFCRCEARFGAPPNTLVCPVCTGQPGVLPVPNREALRLGVLAGLMLRCRIDPVTRFDRKNYFYPDLPKGYQISQFDRPLCREGELFFDAPDGQGGSRLRRAAIVRAHLEEDSGKILHPAGMSVSLVDLNRAGTPLLEIVGAPDLRSPEEASAWLVALRRLLRHAGVSECDMEQGSFRCDANVSLRPVGSTAFGTRCEIKNLNSFRFVAQALAAEIERQTAVLQSGGRVAQQTMAFDPDTQRTRAMRTKEAADDYRYFPEPDLPLLDVDAALAPDSVESLASRLPERPHERAARYVNRLGLPSRDAESLVAERELAEWFERALAAPAALASPPLSPTLVANWLLVDVLRLCNEHKRPLDELSLSPERLAELVRLVADERLSVQAGRQVVVAMEGQPGQSAAAVAAQLDLLQVSDSGELSALVASVLAEQADMVARYRAGRTGLFHALLGAVMKASGGKANPQTVRELLEAELGPPG